MFSTREFFKSNKDTKIGSHSPTVAKWMLQKFKSKYRWLRVAIESNKFDTAQFIDEWSQYLKELTPWQVIRAWEHLDNIKERRVAPTLHEFKKVIGKVSLSLSFKEAHDSAVKMGVIVMGCDCEYCKANESKISMNPKTYTHLPTPSFASR